MGFFQSILPWIVAGVCVVFFYKAALVEDNGHGPLWAALSALVSVACLFLLGGTWHVVLGGQAVLFVGIGVARAIGYLRSMRQPPPHR